jgi:2-aminoethylphosphonate-pyruvate transaminase
VGRLPARFRPPHLPPDQEPALLLNPGPINVSQRVAEALLLGDMCHREPEYGELQAEIRRLLLEAFVPQAPDDFAALLLTGSGTAALEAMISSLVGHEGRLLVLDNGVYGDRIARIADAHGIQSRRMTWGWTQPVDVAAVAQALDEDQTLTAVAAVHHETTTGLLNPIRDLARVVQDAGRSLLLDSVSGMGGEHIDLAGWGVDAVACTANKCIRGLPGMAFVLASRAILERARATPPRSLYLHLPTYFDKQEAGTIPFTPTIQIAYAFREALRELLEEGVEARVAHCEAMGERLRAGLEGLGLELLLPPARRSNTISAAQLPTGWTYTQLHDALRAEGVVIYAGQGDLAKTAFRVCNMGVMDEADYDRVLASLARCLERGPNE